MVIDLLLKRSAELGVQIRYETGATNLIVDGDAVVGVAWKKFAETGSIRARAVVIAAGGFVMNPPDMVAKFTPKLAEKPFVLGNTYDDGLGIRLGESVGGATKHMDQVFITAPVYPPSILLTGIIVNKEGKRFVTEDSYHSRTSGFVMDQPDSAAYLIVDEAHMQRPEIPLITFIDGWETVEEMEAALGIPTGNLVETLKNYNENAAKGEDPEFHKQPEFLAPQDKGPWGGAFDLTLGKAMYSGFTVGGLATDVDGEVLRADGSVIPGLYAAGGVCVQHRPGWQGLRQRHAAGGGGLVLRPPGRNARRQGGSRRLKPLGRRHYPVVVGEHDCRGAVAQPELGEDPADMGLDRQGRDSQLVGDLAVGPAAGDQRQHILLAWCDTVEGWGGGAGRRGSASVCGQDAGGHRRIEEAVPGRHRVHRPDELFGR